MIAVDISYMECTYPLETIVSSTATAMYQWTQTDGNENIAAQQDKSEAWPRTKRGEIFLNIECPTQKRDQKCSGMWYIQFGVICVLDC